MRSRSARRHGRRHSQKVRWSLVAALIIPSALALVWAGEPWLSPRLARVGLVLWESPQIVLALLAVVALARLKAAGKGFWKGLWERLSVQAGDELITLAPAVAEAVIRLGGAWLLPPDSRRQHINEWSARLGDFRAKHGTPLFTIVYAVWIVLKARPTPSSYAAPGNGQPAPGRQPQMETGKRIGGVVRYRFVGGWLDGQSGECRGRASLYRRDDADRPLAPEVGDAEWFPQRARRETIRGLFPRSAHSDGRVQPAQARRFYFKQRVADEAGRVETVYVHASAWAAWSREVDRLDADGTPHLLTFARSDEGLLKVWCRWCEVWHMHGRGYGHAGAHCHREDSPYHETGYVLVNPTGIERVTVSM